MVLTVGGERSEAPPSLQIGGTRYARSRHGFLREGEAKTAAAPLRESGFKVRILKYKALVAGRARDAYFLYMYKKNMPF